jgi:hypothetical protein
MQATAHSLLLVDHLSLHLEEQHFVVICHLPLHFISNLVLLEPMTPPIESASFLKYDCVARVNSQVEINELVMISEPQSIAAPEMA